MFFFLLALIACWIPLQMALSMPLWLSQPLYFLIGFFVTGYTITLASTKEANSPALSGIATGVVNTGTFLGGAILQPLVGGIMDYGWQGQLAASGARLYSLVNYQAGFAAISAFLILSLICALRVRETYCRYVQA